MVAAQMWKYTVGAAHLSDALAWNEASRRYVTIATEFYIPIVWRGAPSDRKQGSEGEIDAETSRILTQRLMDNCENGRLDYEEALALGVAPEQARLFLNAYGLYTTWRWSGSLAMWMHVLEQRLDHAAQHENQEYARAIRDILLPLFPVSLAGFAEALDSPINT
jgi:thymidylate synthase (FAD)